MPSILLERANEAYKHLVLQMIRPGVLEVRMNRPKRRNAFNVRHWEEIGNAFTHVIPHMADARCILLTGAGPVFSAGIDLKNLGDGIGGAVAGVSNGLSKDEVINRACSVLRTGGNWQNAWRALNSCPKPVICAIQKGCYGAALELVCFADVRFCSSDCQFQAPEVDLAFAADIGGNQMFPKIVGNDSLVRELQLSGRRFGAKEALQFGLVSRVLPSHAELLVEARNLAEAIAAKSPIATMGVKKMLNYSRDHSVDDALKFGLTWNAAMIQTKDTMIAAAAFLSKQKPAFPDASLHVPDGNHHVLSKL